MKRLLLIGMVLLCAFSTSFAQIPLATQGFESGDTWTYSSYPDLYDFNNGDRVILACYDWSKESGYGDHLRISLREKKFKNFLRFKAYE